MKRIRLILLLLVCLCDIHLFAQNSTSSPSSRFGYGEMNENIPTAYRGMGGVSTGMRLHSAINPSQPASYTACDSMTFMFDLAASGMWTRYEDSNGHRNRPNGNLEFVTLQFPIWKRHIAFSAGIMPYTSVGYNFALDGNAGGYDYKLAYEGEGGITNVYAGLSFNILNWFAAGANAYYMFGDATNAINLTFTDATIQSSVMYRNMTVRSFRFRYGAQLFHTFGKHNIVLGAVVENKQKLRGEFVQYELTTLDSVLVQDNGFQIPLYYSAGASYCYDDRLLIAADYSVHNWKDAKYFGLTDVLNNCSRYALGLEYRHNRMSRHYAERMYWRVGATVTDSYVQQGAKKDFSVSAGVGFPLRTSETLFNLSLEYTRRHSTAQLIEDNLKLTVNVAVAENWFFKRKL
ncbi:MAG: hypothetical protein K5660_08725 [Paludibacteraceae bacterium]|nr:hypothetical protein [Paludibacteraceae bacterium]